MYKSLSHRIIRYLKDAELIPTYGARRRAAIRHLQGTGLEIGAMHQPLPVPSGVVVKYVDYATREESIAHFPEIDSRKVVEVDHVEDGFVLGSIKDASQDFLVANHVLEHSSNPIQVLLNWTRVLKPGGVLFVTLPIGNRCFDKGRPVTPIDHIIDDYELNRAGKRETFVERNREHYRQWLEVSLPAIARIQGTQELQLDEEAKHAKIDEMTGNTQEIHFHVFSPVSVAHFFNSFTERYAKGFRVVEIKSSKLGAECIVILKRTGAAAQ